MTSQPLFYWNEKHPKTQPQVLDFTYNITGAKACSPVVQGADSYVFYDAITQSDIDNYLGVANDFPSTYFDSTSMGADTFGGLVRMSGYTPSGITPTAAQGASIVKMEAFCASNTGLVDLVQRFANGNNGMTASTLETACAVSTTGNFGFKINFGNTPDFDGLSSGLIVVRLYWISK